MTCPACNRASADDLLCTGPTSCTATLAAGLDSVEALASTALVTYRRGARIGLASGRRGDPQPLPYDERVRPALDDLGAAVGALVYLVETRRRTPAPQEHPTRWLLEQVDWLRCQTDSLEEFQALQRALDKLERVVDRPADRCYAGPCNNVDDDGLECGEQLYARPGAPRVTCRRCGAWYDVSARREWMVDAAQDVLAGAQLLAQALTNLDVAVTAGRIYVWAHRGRLVKRGVDERGRPLYRLGDVRDLLAEHQRRSA